MARRTVALMGSSLQVFQIRLADLVRTVLNLYDIII